MDSYLSLKGMRLGIEAIEIEGWIYDDSDSGPKWSLNVEGRKSTFADDVHELTPLFYDECMPLQVTDWTQLEHTRIEFDLRTAQNRNEPTLCLWSHTILPRSLIELGERDGDRFKLRWSGLADPNIGEFRTNVPFFISGQAVLARFGVRFWESGDEGADYEAEARRIMHKRGMREDNLTFAGVRRFRGDVNHPYHRLMLALFRPI